ncbi:MAG: hypothetical protein RJQ09_17160 [Cyclobacteriaceae bacterium]
MLGSVLTLFQDVEDILTKHFSASGQDLLTSFRTAELTGKMLRENQVEFSFNTYLKKPGKIRVDIKSEASTFSQIVNGKSGWYVTSDDADKLPRSEVENLLSQWSIDVPLWNAKNDKSQIEFSGKKTINDGRYFHLMVSTTNSRMNYFINEKTHLLFRTIEEQLGSPKVIIETTYLNYRDFGGIKIPMLIQSIGPNGKLQIFLDDIVYDAAVSDALFTKPE